MIGDSFKNEFARYINFKLCEAIREEKLSKPEVEYMDTPLGWRSDAYEYLMKNNICQWAKDYYGTPASASFLFDSCLEDLEKALEDVTSLTWYEFSQKENGVWVAAELLSQEYFNEVLNRVIKVNQNHGTNDFQYDYHGYYYDEEDDFDEEEPEEPEFIELIESEDDFKVFYINELYNIMLHAYRNGKLGAFDEGFIERTKAYLKSCAEEWLDDYDDDLEDLMTPYTPELEEALKWENINPYELLCNPIAQYEAAECLSRYLFDDVFDSIIEICEENDFDDFVEDDTEE